jgi:NADH-quinone oxidoreductase subunit J
VSLSTVLFYLFAVVAVGGAAVVVFANRLIHAVFALLFAFFGVAGLYLFLNADFIAASQVLIYVGGILVLMLFGVMLTTRIYDMRLMAERVQFKPSVIVVGAGFAMLAAVILKTPWPVIDKPDSISTAKTIGSLLMTDYVLPFEVVGVLLLAALLGASMLSSRDGEEEEGDL